MNSILIILIGCEMAIASASIGTFLVLRNMSMMSDAIAHAVLPGIATAFLITGSKSTLTMVIGALIAALLTTFLIEFSNKFLKVQTDAAIGVNFTWLFAVGIIIVSAFSKKVDLDPDCILYGEIGYAPISKLKIFGQNIGPKACYTLFLVLIINLVTLFKFFYRGFVLTTFDETFSKSSGLKLPFYHYLLMCLTSLTTVIMLELAGVVMTVAFIVIPAATAYLIATSVFSMFIYASIFGSIAVISGYLLASKLDNSISACMSTVAAVIFSLVLVNNKVKKIS